MSSSTSTSTRDSILYATSVLLVTRGYRGTSTRDIASAVGIRQPSLFHHFQSKRAILTELLDRDLGPAGARVRYFAGLPGAAAPRLYAYILADYRALATSPYDVRGIYTSELLNDPDFVEYRASFDRFNEDLRGIVRQGIVRGEFREVSPVATQQAIAGMFYAAIWRPPSLPAEEVASWPEQSGELILRGLLRRPSEFPRVRREAESLLASMPESSSLGPPA
jgi:AcrR family transcriptional regulator